VDLQEVVGRQEAAEAAVQPAVVAAVAVVEHRYLRQV
jgi:hypothetical protein